MPRAEPAPGGWSLRTRLLIGLAVLIAGLMAGGAAAMYQQAREASQRLYDDSLRQTASLLAQLATHEVEEHGPALGETLFHLETQTGPFQLHYQVWTQDRKRAYRTQGAPEQPYLPLGNPGFGWTHFDGQIWRVYSTIGPNGDLELQIAESLRYRSELPRAIFWKMAGSVLVLLALGLPLIAWILQAGFAGVQRVARAVAQRPAADLAPVAAASLPREVQPLIGALNRQFGKLRALLESERRFTADAAHELRTPLAAIRLNAQLLAGADTPQSRQELAADLMAGVDRSSRLVEQLLAMARIDAGQARQQLLMPVDLAMIVASQVPEQQRAAERRGTTLEAQAGHAQVAGDTELLAILLRNLVDNAIRYGGARGHVRVESGLVDGRAALSVSDDGPGVPADARDKVFERFHRVEGSGEYGSGLGLSIVQRIAELHGAQVELGDGPGGRGARFVVRFPPAAAAAQAAPAFTPPPAEPSMGG